MSYVQAGKFLGDPALADTALSSTDLATLRLYLSEHVFAAGGSADSFKVRRILPHISPSACPLDCRLLSHARTQPLTRLSAACVQVDSKRSVFVCLDFYHPETLLYLYRESILSDATTQGAKPHRPLELLGAETTVLLAVTDHNVYVLDLGFAKGAFRDGPKPLLLGR